MSEEFRTTNYGKSWQQVHFKQLQVFNNRGLLQFTKDPNIIWTIDATSLGGSDIYRPTKSTDGGKSFSPIASDPTTGEAYYLYADGENPERALVADYKNIYLTTDGGASWKKVYTTNIAAGIHIGGVLFSGAKIFIGTSTGIVASEDQGANFSKRTDISGIDTTTQAILSFTGMKMDGSDNYIFYAVVSSRADVYGGVTALDRPGFSGIYVLNLSAKTWQRKVSGIGSDAELYFVGVASAQNSSQQIAYAAGGSSTSVPVVYKTTDAGDTWKSVFNSNANTNITTGWSGSGGDRGWSYGEVALGFAVNPANANELLFTDFGFAHLSTDGGDTWRQTYVSEKTQNTGVITKGKSYESVGIENTTCWHVVWLDSLNLYACFSDIQGCRSTDGGATWSFNYSGHNDNSLYYVLKDPKSNIVYGATSTVHDMYQSTYLQDARIDNGKGKVLFSTNNGAAWQTLHDFQHPVIWLALDPTKNNRMYASVIHSTQGGVYITNNLDAGAASQWTKLPNPPRTEGHPFCLKVLNDGSLLATYSARRNSSGQFTASSGVFLWDGVSWSDRSDAGMQYWTKDIVIDPNDASQATWYVAVFSGWGGAPNGKGGLYRTTNDGNSWTRINNLDRVTSLSFVPGNSHQAYLTTETDGLWFTNDITAANPVFTLVQSYAFRQPERVYFNPYKKDEVWVTSFGNGMKVSAQDIPNPLPGKVRLISPADNAMILPSAVNFSWESATDAKRYVLTVTIKENGSVVQNDTLTNTSTVAKAAASVAGNYHWQVRALNDNGAGEASDVWRYSIPVIEDVHEGNNMLRSIAPNPVKDVVSISYASLLPQKVYVELSDISGRKVLLTAFDATVDTVEYSMDIRSLPLGAYSLRLIPEQSGKVLSRMIIKE